MTLDDIDFNVSNGDDGTLVVTFGAEGMKAQIVFPDLDALQDLLTGISNAAVLTAYGVKGGTA